MQDRAGCAADVVGADMEKRRRMEDHFTEDTTSANLKWPLFSLLHCNQCQAELPSRLPEAALAGLPQKWYSFAYGHKHLFGTSVRQRLDIRYVGNTCSTATSSWPKKERRKSQVISYSLLFPVLEYQGEHNIARLFSTAWQTEQGRGISMGEEGKGPVCMKALTSGEQSDFQSVQGCSKAGTPCYTS